MIVLWLIIMLLSCDLCDCHVTYVIVTCDICNQNSLKMKMNIKMVKQIRAYKRWNDKNIFYMLLNECKFCIFQCAVVCFAITLIRYDRDWDQTKVYLYIRDWSLLWSLFCKLRLRKHVWLAVNQRLPIYFDVTRLKRCKFIAIILQ